MVWQSWTKTIFSNDAYRAAVKITIIWFWAFLRVSVRVYNMIWKRLFRQMKDACIDKSLTPALMVVSARHRQGHVGALPVPGHKWDDSCESAHKVCVCWLKNNEQYIRVRITKRSRFWITAHGSSSSRDSKLPPPDSKNIPLGENSCLLVDTQWKIILNVKHYNHFRVLSE